MAWTVAVLVVVLWLITTVLKRRSASLLYVLWLLVLVRLVLPPEFAFPTGWGWWFRSDRAAASTQGLPTAPPEELRGDASSGVPSAPPTIQPESPSLASVPFGLVLMIAWLGIVAARCGMLLTAAIQVHVWVTRAQPIFDPDLRELLDESRLRVGVRRNVDLRDSEACSTPLVVGIWRPVLLLPSAVLDRLNLEQLRSVLIHELHHVKRWDGLVNLLQGVLGAIYFFHPAVWWANRRIRQLREDACDERTVAVLDGNRKPYGEAIFRVAEILGYSAPPLTLGVLDSTSPLTQRLRRILDPRLPTDNGRPWQSALILVIAVAVLLPAGARPSALVADANSERRIVAEAFSNSPMGSVKKHRLPGPHREMTATEDVTPAESVLVAPDVLEDPEPSKALERLDLPGANEMPETPKRPAQAEDSALDQPSIEDLVHDLSVLSQRRAAVSTLLALGTVAEPALLELLADGGSATRSAIYEILAGTGSERSILPLQQALLIRSSSEQGQIERALDAIYGRLQISVSNLEPSVNSSRIYETDSSSDDW